MGGTTKADAFEPLALLTFKKTHLAPRWKAQKGSDPFRGGGPSGAVRRALGHNGGKEATLGPPVAPSSSQQQTRK